MWFLWFDFTLGGGFMAVCLGCGSDLDDVWGQDHLIHPSCHRVPIVRAEEDNGIRRQVQEVMRWADENSPRSLQVNLGPSEIGHPCDRRIGYGLAGVPKVNTQADPLAAIVGTASHKWMEDAIASYQAGVRNLGWITEMELPIDGLVVGHTDVYVAPDVWDWKFPSSKRLKKYKEKEVPELYEIQGHLYGLGHERAGREVRDVVLNFLPRDGRLRDLFVYRIPYDREIATRALERVYSIGYRLIALEVERNPHRWNDVEAKPSPGCWYCPWRLNRGAEYGADDKGCPGTGGTTEENLQTASDRFWK